MLRLRMIWRVLRLRILLRVLRLGILLRVLRLGILLRVLRSGILLRVRRIWSLLRLRILLRLRRIFRLLMLRKLWRRRRLSRNVEAGVCLSGVGISIRMVISQLTVGDWTTPDGAVELERVDHLAVNGARHSSVSHGIASSRRPRGTNGRKSRRLVSPSRQLTSIVSGVHKVDAFPTHHDPEHACHA